MHPRVEIASRLLRARLYLPDAERGYYRATRFDWSGVIAGLEDRGHQYFGPWFERHDPLKHDGIVGPAEEFDADSGGLGYREAAAGEPFVRIGVGVLRKPEEAAYQRFGSYPIVDPGCWTVRAESDRVEFDHQIAGASGYSYAYRKLVRLEPDRPILWLEHALRNTGRRPIETSQYNHNFFVIDGSASGPGFVLRFPFEPRLAAEATDVLAVRERTVLFRAELPPGASVFTRLGGFGPAAVDHDITIENRATGAGVRIRGDRPLADLAFWAIRRTLCPEPYLAISVAAGAEATWKTQYEFYRVPSEAASSRSVLIE